MVWVPWVSVDVEKLALPLTSDTFSDFVPSLKVTVTVGEPVPERLAFPCALKVTFCPTLLGLGELLVRMSVPPVLSSTETLALDTLATTRSGLPSEFKSPAANPSGFFPPSS